MMIEDPDENRGITETTDFGTLIRISNSFYE
jgi:hypothetical protein